MPNYRFKGSYGSSVNLTQPRTAELTAEDPIPSDDMVLLSAYARIYVSTTNRTRTYNYHVVIDDDYSGDLEYKFASVDSPVYVNVPIDVEALDPDFPMREITTITVTETNGYGDSTRIRGTVRVFVEYALVGTPTPPTNILIDGQTAINLQAGHTANLTWSAGAVGAYDTFVGYQIIQYDPSDGSTTELGTTTNLYYEITAPYEDSRSYYYYVQIVTLYKVGQSSTFASIYTFIPLTAPTFLTPNPYNPRPMVLVTLGDGPRSDLLTLIADGWTPSRRALPNSKLYLKRNTTYKTPTTQTVTVTETDELVRSITGNLPIDYAPYDYTQDDIIAGTTLVMAADITELQTALNTIRYGYGMTASVFTPCVQQETSLGLWETHIAELQNSVREIQNFVNAWDSESISYKLILPTMITSFGPNAAVLNQLRMIVTML